MALLKKIKSATLVEALIATTLIVVVFIIASLVLNNLLLNSFSRNTHAVENRIYELQYLAKNKKLQLPYEETFGNWRITIVEESLKDKKWISTIGIHMQNNKEFKSSTLCRSQE